MKTNYLISAVSLLLLSTFVVSAQTPTAAAVPLSPAQQKLALAQAGIEKNPEYVEYHNDLASALTRRARETADPVYYRQAEEALQKSFRLAPDNYNGQKIQVQILLGKHEFTQALELAKELNARFADDIFVYGLIADAASELGNYREAETAVQWMLNLRHAGASGFLRVAYLRELFGDTDGALEAMNAAYEATNPGEVEERARTLTRMARLALASGRIESAETLLRRALKLFPGYHYALTELAGVRTVQQKHAEALDLWRRECQSVPHPRNLYALAGALEQAGRVAESKRAYAEFEEKARGRIESADNANRELIFYYADRARKPAEALRIARREVAQRRDTHTLDAYAWALFVNREYAESRRQMERALSVGIRDANFLYHAGAILAKLNDRRTAKRYWQQSLDLNPVSASAKSARQALARTGAPLGSVPRRRAGHRIPSDRKVGSGLRASGTKPTSTDS